MKTSSSSAVFRARIILKPKRFLEKKNSHSRLLKLLALRVRLKGDRLEGKSLFDRRRYHDDGAAANTKITDVIVLDGGGGDRDFRMNTGERLFAATSRAQKIRGIGKKCITP